MNRLRLIGLSSVGALTMSVLWLLVSGCRPIEKDSPERPAVATSAQVFSTNPVPVEIEDDRVLVRGTLNGREVRLVLDTGASDVLLSPETAAAAGIQRAAEVRFGAFGNGRGTAKKGVADSVSVGPAAAEMVPAAIMAFPPPFTDDGLLGLSFLRQITFRLDYQQKPHMDALRGEPEGKPSHWRISWLSGWFFPSTKKHPGCFVKGRSTTDLDPA